MHTLLDRSARYIYLAGVVLAVVLFIPTAWFPFQIAKIAVFALCLALAAILFAAGGGARELLKAHGFKLALLCALLPLSYLLSAFFSTNRLLAFTGSGVEIDTVLFVTIGFFAFLFSFVLFRTLRTANQLSRVVLWTAVALTLVQWVIALSGTSLIPLSVFSDRTVNLLGKWNDLGLLTSVLLVFLLVRLELSRVAIRTRGLLIAGAIIAALLLGIINFSLAWWFVLAAAAVIGVTAFLTSRREAHAQVAANPYAVPHWASKVPWYSAAGFFLAVVFLLFGSVFNTGLTSVIPVSSLEVRPAYSSTIDVINAARQNVGQMVWGTGPDTFGHAWLFYKSSDINQTPFWNLDFNVGFSTLLTAFGTVGILGAFAWSIPFLLVLLGLIRAVRLGLLSREERIIALMLGLSSCMLFAALALYVPSQSVALLFFVLSGAAFGFLWRQGRAGATEAPERLSRLRQIGVFAMILVLVFLPAWTGIVVARLALAQGITNDGLYALQNGDFDTALARASVSQKIASSPDALRLTIDSGGAKLQHIASTQTAPSTDVQAQFNALVTQTINAGKALIAQAPQDYRSYMSLGNVYELLAQLKVQGAYESAKQAYAAAAAADPSSPAIPLARARLEAAQGNKDATQVYLGDALKLKPNYTDAILMVVQLDIANNDIPNAIKATIAAAQTAPGVAPIWFELGLLYYASQDSKNAIPAFEQALLIVPTYANAKYFLGLSYEAQGRHADALQQFRDLATSNPDSAEVKLILSNLEQGKAPFDSAQPPVTNQPVERSTAPVKE